MSTLDDKRRQFEERLDAVAQRYGSSEKERFDVGEFEAQLHEYERRLDARIEARRRQRQAAIDEIWGGGTVRDTSTGTDATVSRRPGRPRATLHGEPMLQQLDRLFAEEFELTRYFPGRSLQRQPTVYAETLEQFHAPYLELMDVSESNKREALARFRARADAAAESEGGILGIYWPGRGCYLNGWLFGRMASKSPREALSDPEVLPRILGTAVHEKQGHGFVSEFTALGEEKQRLGLWRYDVAQRFGLRDADTPEGALLAEKEAVVYRSSQLLEEGWATWIQHHVMGRWARRTGQPWPQARYTLIEAWDPLARLAHETDEASVKAVVGQVQQALHAVFIAEEVSRRAIHAAILTFHRHGELVDGVFAEHFGQPFRYVIGYLLLRKLEGRLGAFCLPYAVAIAANVTYGLDDVAAGDLQRLVAGRPRLNVDSRLAHLGTVAVGQNGDVQELAHRAREELNLAIPEALKVSI